MRISLTAYGRIAVLNGVFSHYRKEQVTMPAEDTIREQTLPTQRDIVDIEWMMFTAVHGGNGRVFTDTDRRSFAIMRISQFSSWEKFALDSYLNDVRTAFDNNRNLFVFCLF